MDVGFIIRDGEKYLIMQYDVIERAFLCVMEYFRSSVGERCGDATNTNALHAMSDTNLVYTHVSIIVNKLF